MKGMGVFKKIKERGIKYTLTIFDAKYGIGRIERLMSSNWVNPFATIWLNLRSFPIYQAIRFPILVFGRPKLRCLSGSMLIDGKVSFGMIVFNRVRALAPNLMTLQSELINQGKIIFHGKGEIGTGTKITTYFGATLTLGKYFKLQDQVNIGCMKHIKIDDGSWVVHRCQILDSNYHYILDTQYQTVRNHTSPIYIGKNCWIGNTSTIVGGVNLPDETIVASNSLVNKASNSIPTQSLIGGIPAKLIKTGVRRINNSILENEIRIFYKNNIRDIFTLHEGIDPNSIN